MSNNLFLKYVLIGGLVLVYFGCFDDYLSILVELLYELLDLVQLILDIWTILFIRPFFSHHILVSSMIKLGTVVHLFTDIKPFLIQHLINTLLIILLSFVSKYLIKVEILYLRLQVLLLLVLFWICSFEQIECGLLVIWVEYFPILFIPIVFIF